MDKLFGAWLSQTRELQTQSYGTDPAELDPDARAAYFREMGFAALVELGEMSNEIGWKSWGSNRDLNREHYLKEGVDVLHFIANLLVAGGITDEELNAAYLAKMDVNRRRMASGTYAGRVDNKCPNCARSFDDVDRSEKHEKICVICSGERKIA